MGMDKDPAKDPSGSDSALTPDIPFFTVAKQKGKDFAPKGWKKGKNKDKDKRGYKGKDTGKGKNYKGWLNQLDTI